MAAPAPPPAPPAAPPAPPVAPPAAPPGAPPAAPAAPPAPPAPGAVPVPPAPAGGGFLAAAITEYNQAAAAEKAQYANKIRTLQQDPNGKNKWWLFCKAHANGNGSIDQHDQAFLMTFLEAYEAGAIMDEPPAAPSNSWGNNSGGGGGGEPNLAKVFVGALPRGTTEDKLWQYFGQWGAIEKIDAKKDEEGNPRGFAFVTFKDVAIAKQVIDNKEYNKMDGKWIDCKLAEGKEKGGGKGGKDKGKDGKDGKDGKGKDGGKGGDNNNNWNNNNNNNNSGGWNNNSGGDNNNWNNNNNNNGGGNWNNNSSNNSNNNNGQGGWNNTNNNGSAQGGNSGGGWNN